MFILGSAANMSVKGEIGHSGRKKQKVKQNEIYKKEHEKRNS